MFNQWINRIKSIESSNASDSQLDVERVSASLLVEIARADHQLEQTEIQAITKALQQSSSLPDDEVKALVDAAVADADSTLSLHEHVRVINEQFEREEKVLLIEQMWRVAGADGNVDHYEDYTIRKLTELLHMPHRDFIQAKLKVLGK